VKRALAFAPLVALALLSVLFVGWSLKRDPEVRPDALVGEPLPAVALAPLDGGAPVPLDAAVRGPALVNVFASWCVPCEVEHPELVRLQAAGVPIVGVAYKDERTPNATQGFLERLGDPYEVVLKDPDGRAGIELGVSGVPETYVVGADGTVLAKHAGPLLKTDADRLEAVWREARQPTGNPSR
jgi:cytochrome c biogenesis protein CcmG/thiol:disulfide interchange protein DsbE